MKDLLRRCRIGPAHTRCPAEKISLWMQRNLLILIATAIGLFLWWWLVYAVVGFINWLSTGGEPDKMGPLEHDSPGELAVRIVGGILIFFFMVAKSRR